MTFYCPPSLKKAFDEFCRVMGVKKSERLRKHMEDDVASVKGSFQREFDLEAKKAERVKWKKIEFTLAKLLQDEVCDKSRKTAYETMIYFAVALGTDAALEKNIEDVLKQLHLYECHNGPNGDAFTSSTLETFIEYVEAVLKRRAIENEIKLHRRQKLKSG